MSAAHAVAERAGAVTVRVDGKAAHVTLARPERRNALVPELLEDLRDALRALCCDGLAAVVIGAEGETFSSGGDVSAFLDAATRGPEAARAYAMRTVGALNDCIKALIALPVPVVTRVQGFATGGACGFVFTSDLVVMAEDAFLQPYYGEVGFAPDGGWTALLPEIVGPGRAVAFQATNHRIEAAEAVALGIATKIAPADKLDDAVEQLVAKIAAKESGTLRAARALVWDKARREAVAARLDAEQAAFVKRIGLPETKERMERFVIALRRRRTGQVDDGNRDGHGGPAGRADA
jgi:2-(1,2-epoxy-1,2-dihydrophenyl)acetyl-CoA isomerase